MDEEDMEDIDEDYILTSRLEAGLFTLQQSALIMGNLWFHNDVHLRKRILLLLHQQVWRPQLCPLRQHTTWNLCIQGPCMYHPSHIS